MTNVNEFPCFTIYKVVSFLHRAGTDNQMCALFCQNILLRVRQSLSVTIYYGITATVHKFQLKLGSVEECWHQDCCNLLPHFGAK